MTLWIHVNDHVMCYFWDFGPLGDECLQVGSPVNLLSVRALPPSASSGADCPVPAAWGRFASRNSGGLAPITRWPTTAQARVNDSYLPHPQAHRSRGGP